MGDEVPTGRVKEVLIRGDSPLDCCADTEEYRRIYPAARPATIQNATYAEAKAGISTRILSYTDESIPEEADAEPEEKSEALDLGDAEATTDPDDPSDEELDEAFAKL